MATSRADQVKELVLKYDLARADVAELLGVSVHTVNAWLRPPSNAGHREPPATAVELLRLKLRRRRVKS